MEEGWNQYAQRFDRKPGNHPLFTRAFGRSHHGPLNQDDLLMSEQIRRQFNSAATPFIFKNKVRRNTPEPASTPTLLRDAIGLEKVVDNLDSDRWAERQPIWMPLLNLLPALKTYELWTPFSSGYLQIDAERIQRWASILQRTPGKCLIALHWQGNPGHEHSLYSRGRSLPFERLLPLGQLSVVDFVSVQKGAGSEKLQFNKALRFVVDRNRLPIDDFKDTAAVLANCDLLISSDSRCTSGRRHGNPHLASPTVDTEWRWG